MANILEKKETLEMYLTFYYFPPTISQFIISRDGEIEKVMRRQVLEGR